MPDTVIDEENVETTGERCCRLSWRTPYVHRNEVHISPTFMYIIPMYLKLTAFTKTLPQMSFHIFVSLWGSTHDSVDCWSAHRPPAACNSFKCVRL